MSGAFDHESMHEPSMVGVGSIGECGPFCRMTWNSAPGIELRARDEYTTRNISSRIKLVRSHILLGRLLICPLVEDEGDLMSTWWAAA